MTTSDVTNTAESSARERLTRLLDGVRPWDEQERGHLATATRWAAGTEPLYRTRKPDVPPKHLVVYFVVFDQRREELLLGAHRKAGLWLPAGGHVEPGEDPWEAVVRECREELHIQAAPARDGDRNPFFVTVTRTRGEGTHIDVCLWFVLRGTTEEITSFDEGEFDAIRWLSPLRVLAEPQHTLDPHMHRFTRKLLAAIARA
ncbi:NUDIX hydrolase [Embleya sp. MST-111070]|uniref:NUDIX hydrolase n=1 Tax=Embleya sp. MST-111070 TaxID=3398231 RepID=UPI003F73633A